MCLQLIGLAFSTFGALAAAKGQSDALKAQAAQNEMNKVVASNNAKDARDQGVADTQDLQLRNRARIGMQQNTLSERNIATNSGSALDILGDTAAMGKLDELTAQNNAERKAVAYETQSIQYGYQAQVDRASAKNAMTAGVLNAFGGLATGIGKMYNPTTGSFQIT